MTHCLKWNLKKISENPYSIPILVLRLLNQPLAHCDPTLIQTTAAALKKPTTVQKVQKNQMVTNVTYLFLLLLDEEPTTNFAVSNPAAARFGVFSPLTIVFMELLDD